MLFFGLLRDRTGAPQINLGCLETYWASGWLVIALLQGCTRVMSFKKKLKKKGTGQIRAFFCCIDERVVYNVVTCGFQLSFAT